MIAHVKLLENIHMKGEAVAKDYQLYACMSMFSTSLGLTSHSPGCPTLRSFQDFVFDPWPIIRRPIPCRTPVSCFHTFDVEVKELSAGFETLAG